MAAPTPTQNFDPIWPLPRPAARGNFLTKLKPEPSNLNYQSFALARAAAHHFRKVGVQLVGMF
jgi:hypothetical protein